VEDVLINHYDSGARRIEIMATNKAKNIGLRTKR
jgi:hypothetical protein